VRPRIAVLGAGAWGVNHIRVLASERACELVAVADPDPAVAERVRAIAPDVAIAPDPDRILADRTIDAVVIATPAPTHAHLAAAAMRAGKHALIEKPLALSVRDARALVALADERDVVGMVGHLMVFHPAVVRLRELMTSGALGELHYLHSTRVNLGRIRQDWPGVVTTASRSTRVRATSARRWPTWPATISTTAARKGRSRTSSTSPSGPPRSSAGMT
jgi:predicted dehydrogenase